jgi:hypothetical protein
VAIVRAAVIHKSVSEKAMMEAERRDSPVPTVEIIRDPERCQRKNVEKLSSGSGRT